MKDYLNKIIAARSKDVEDLRARIKASESADEVRALGETLQSVLDELNEAKAKLDEIDNDDQDNEDTTNDGSEEAASKDESSEARSATFDPMMTIGGATMASNIKDVRSNDDPRATMEYRSAFMNYVQKGVKSEILEERGTDATGTSSDLGVLIPTTIIQEIIKGVEGVYGQLYSRVRKLNVKGGVKFPIGSFSATFNRITETTKSDRQDAGGVTGAVVFEYKIGEIRLARTLLQTILSVPVFEEEFSKVIVEAYVKAMDKEIVSGDKDLNQMEGILSDEGIARIDNSHIIEFTEADMADWTKWQEKLFAIIPIGMRSEKPEFVMTANTYEANIKTLKDQNNRPLYAETFNPVDGSEVCTFKGRPVVLVEDDVFENFNDAENNEYFGMYWVPNKAYGINSNLEFTVTDYFDHETNQWIKKALVINDGKILDGGYIYLLKKSVAQG